MKNFLVQKIMQVMLGAAEKFSLSAKVQKGVSKTNSAPSHQHVDLYNLFLKMLQRGCRGNLIHECNNILYALRNETRTLLLLVLTFLS